MAKATNTKTAVDSVTTLAQLSAGKLERATQGLAKIVEELQGASEEHRELVEKIELKQGELGQMELEYKEKERQLKLDLQMRGKEEAESLVQEILKSQGRVSIETSELSSIKKELEDWKNNFESKVKSEVAKTVSVISERHDSQIKTKELEFKATSATIIAELSSANGKVESLQSQINEYKDIIDKERSARVEEAKARGGEKVSITTSK